MWMLDTEHDDASYVLEEQLGEGIPSRCREAPARPGAVG
jgi:hypothetical protein